jgi:hypothetical protein
MRGLLRAAGRCVSLAASAESISVHALRWEYRADAGTERTPGPRSRVMVSGRGGSSGAAGVSTAR